MDKNGRFKGFLGLLAISLPCFEVQAILNTSHAVMLDKRGRRVCLRKWSD